MRSDFLIIGCTSSVGSRLLSLLLDQGFKVSGIRHSSPCQIKHENHTCTSLDILSTDPKTITSMYPSENLILASWITTPGIFWDSPINLEWAAAYKAVITDFQSHGGMKVIGIGSCAEYAPQEEAALSELSPTEPLTTYGKSKLDVFKHLSNSEGEYLWVRPFFQYGPDDDERKFISSLINSFRKNQEFTLQDPDGLRDYVYIDDVANVLVRLINKRAEGEFNIGTGSAVSNHEVASFVCKALEGKGKILVSRNVSKPKPVLASTEKLKREIGQIDWTSIEAGITRIIRAKNASQKGEVTA